MMAGSDGVLSAATTASGDTLGASIAVGSAYDYAKKARCNHIDHVHIQSYSAITLRLSLSLPPPPFS
jgi:hypothetical protein